MVLMPVRPQMMTLSAGPKWQSMLTASIQAFDFVYCDRSFTFAISSVGSCRLTLVALCGASGTHGILGSVFGCDLLDPLREAGLIDEVTDQLALCGKWGFYMKEMYRQNFLTARDDCEIPESDTSPLLTLEGMDCGFTCNPKTIALMSKELSKVCTPSHAIHHLCCVSSVCVEAARLNCTPHK